jgi:ribose/xylose/arabinose/galactoside ABC-type transport system permease subunit
MLRHLFSFFRHHGLRVATASCVTVVLMAGAFTGVLIGDGRTDLAGTPFVIATLATLIWWRLRCRVLAREPNMWIETDKGLFR